MHCLRTVSFIATTVQIMRVWGTYQSTSTLDRSRLSPKRDAVTNRLLTNLKGNCDTTRSTLSHLLRRLPSGNLQAHLCVCFLEYRLVVRRHTVGEEAPKRTVRTKIGAVTVNSMETMRDRTITRLWFLRSKRICGRLGDPPRWRPL